LQYGHFCTLASISFAVNLLYELLKKLYIPISIVTGSKEDIKLCTASPSIGTSLINVNTSDPENNITIISIKENKKSLREAFSKGFVEISIFSQYGTRLERESVREYNTTVSDTHAGKVVVSRERGIEVKRDIVYEDNITSLSPMGGLDMTSDRYVNIGETFLHFSTVMDWGGGIRPTVTFECKLESKLDDFSFYGYSYAGEILKIQCIFSSTDVEIAGVTYHPYSLTYRYVQKGVGVIAEIEDHCAVDPGLELVDDRNLDTCTDTLRQHQYQFLEE
jgi:hypothetical protein